MKKDIFISSHPDETWPEIIESLSGYLEVETTNSAHNFDSGVQLHLETGESFRSVGGGHQTIHHIDLICRWCAQTGHHSGLLIDDFFQSTLGSFSNRQYHIVTS